MKPRKQADKPADGVPRLADLIRQWGLEGVRNRLAVNRKDGSILVYVPEGEFEMGDGQDSDCPKHRVDLAAYWMGVSCVSNAQYLKFVEATGHRAPDQSDCSDAPAIWKGRSFPTEKASHPVVCVSPVGWVERSETHRRCRPSPVGWGDRSETHRRRNPSAVEANQHPPMATPATMTNYRRCRLPGGTYFFTVNLADRRTALLTERIDDLRAAFHQVQRAHPFKIQAIAVLPEHLHCLWELPPGDSDYSTRWRQIKAAFSRALPPGERTSVSRARKGERGIWQRRYWEHSIRDDAGYATRLDYIHYNPVKHGYVRAVKDWPYSSFHRYVGLGAYPADWAGDGVLGLELEEG